MSALTGYSKLLTNALICRDVLKVQPKLNKPKAPIDVEKDLLILPYSSGTTGSPKGVMLSHKTFGTKMNIFYEHMTTQIFRKMDPNWDWRKENVCLLLPFYHIYGIGVLMTSLRGGSTGVILRQFQPEVFCRTLQNYKMSHACLVPPVLVFLAKSPIVDKYKFPNLKFIMTGAAPSGRELLEEVQKRIPSLKQISQGMLCGHEIFSNHGLAYGMTEESMASHLPVWGKINHSSAGRLMALFEMKIVDVTTRQPLPLGQVGEICCRSPTIMLGYYHKPQATAEAIDEEGWLKTGDLGYQDAEGWTYVVDRLKELIKVKGHQVAPAELEDLLLSHPDIRDCAVIGVPDSKAGEVPKAFVDRANNRLTEQQVADYVKDKLIHYKYLAGGVEFIDEVPKSAAGKILRRFLRDREAKKRSKL
ncbi:Protein ACS-14 [Aphelenchoides avenae]|nr:Protein ACS-14 [Aphelenchus avenae]